MRERTGIVRGVLPDRFSGQLELGTQTIKCRRRQSGDVSCEREIVQMHREQCGLTHGQPGGRNGCAECARPDNVRKVGIAARFREVPHGDLGNRGGKVDLLEGFAIPCRFEEMVIEMARRLACRAFFLQQGA